MARHELKCWPGPFQATLDGKKPWELRRNDRNYQVEDELFLREWVPATRPDPVHLPGYTGRDLLVQVDYIMDTEGAAFVALGWENVSPLAPGYVIMSTSPVK